MGKTHRRDARNDQWRKAKQRKFNKKQQHNKPYWEETWVNADMRGMNEEGRNLSDLLLRKT